MKYEEINLKLKQFDWCRNPEGVVLYNCHGLTLDKIIDIRRKYVKAGWLVNFDRNNGILEFRMAKKHGH